MQHGEHHVHAIEATPGLDSNDGAFSAPHAVAADVDRDRHVTGLLKAGPHGSGGCKRYLVLGGAAASEHRDADGIHGVGVVDVPVVDVVDVVVVGAVVVVVVVGVGVGAT